MIYNRGRSKGKKHDWENRTLTNEKYINYFTNKFSNFWNTFMFTIFSQVYVNIFTEEESANSSIIYTQTTKQQNKGTTLNPKMKAIIKRQIISSERS